MGSVEAASALLPVWDELSALLCDRGIPSSDKLNSGREEAIEMGERKREKERVNRDS